MRRLAGPLIWFCLLMSPAVAGQPAWVEAGGDGLARVHLYFFWSETCPHCQEARPFVEAIPRERPWVRLHSLEVSRQSGQLPAVSSRWPQSLGPAAEAVPTLIVLRPHGSGLAGRRDIRRRRLLRALDDCRAGGAVAMASGVRRGRCGCPSWARLIRPRSRCPCSPSSSPGWTPSIPVPSSCCCSCSACWRTRRTGGAC